MKSIIQLKRNWKFRQAETETWYPANVPGVVHTDLVKNELIPNPFFRTNEHDLQWIDKKDWEYMTRFRVSWDQLGLNCDLVFDGLDTYAEVYLNDTHILSADNMFCNWRVDCSGRLVEGVNELRILFRSPVTVDLPKLEQLGYGLPAANDQSELGGLGDNRISVFARKAGYHYGWDWGPRFVTSGIWRPVRLEFWQGVRIEDIRIVQEELTVNHARLRFEIEAFSDTGGDYRVDISALRRKLPLQSINTDWKPGSNTITHRVTIPNPRLWWSRGLGEPYLYTFKCQVLRNEDVLDEKRMRTGLRTVRLVREKDDVGASFAIELNGVPVFAKGANYIPNDSFLPDVSPERYQAVVQAAGDANMNMLRIWGGGIYENDLFYDLCDQQGIMVWQDFMFACSLYPADESFLKNVEQEVRQNVRRLRNHPSIVLWCGNNEIDVAWSHDTEGGWGWKEMYPPDLQRAIWSDYQKLFHQLIPNVLESEDPQRPYWPSSPQADWDQRSSHTSTAGDVHYWGVWHGQEPISEYNYKVGRFMSEYGFQSFADFHTIQRYSIDEDWDIYSKVMLAHQKNKGRSGNEMIRGYLVQHYREPKDFESFLYVGQVLQGEAVRTAIEAHRRHMPYCMGTLYWQLNDCWPVASWAGLDYFLRWKALHYFARKAYQPIMVSPLLTANRLQVHLVSDELTESDAELTMNLMSFGGERLRSETIPVRTPANASRLVLEREVEEFFVGAVFDKTVLEINLIGHDKQLASNVLYLNAVKDLSLSKPEIRVEMVPDQDLHTLRLTSDVLAKNVYLDLPDPTHHFSDNYFDLLPGRPAMVTVTSDLSPAELVDKLKLRSLADSY